MILSLSPEAAPTPFYCSSDCDVGQSIGVVTHLTMLFGRFRGVLISKLAAVAIAMGVRRLIWIVNVPYIGIVIWNWITITGMVLRAK